MAVKVNKDTCIGCGLCASSCQEVFELSSDGKAHAIAQKCSKHDLKEVAKSCPVSAISV